MDIQSRKSTSIFLPHDEPLLGSDDSPSKTSKRTSSWLRKWKYRCFHRFKNVILGLIALANLLISLWIVYEHGNLPEMFPEDHHTNSIHLKAKKCHFPELNPFSSEIKKVMQHPTKIDCKISANSDFRGQTYFKTDLQHNLIRTSTLNIPCCYRPFYRVSDGEVWIEPTKDRRYVCHNITNPITPIPDKYEFIEIICDDSRRSYRDGFAFVPRKPEVEKRVKEFIAEEEEAHPVKTERLSVIILGFDSTSALNFIRLMPKSLEYLTDTLSAVRLKGYVKVGENTLPNLVPLLTGLSVDEFKDLCVEKHPPMESAVHLDHCPFIWKNFAASGYRTSFAEDEVSTGIFNLYWSHAFLEPPTDHYFRPYSLRMFNTQNTYDGFCQGTRMGFEVLMDNVEKTAFTYKDPKDLLFQFTWSSKLTHDDFNKLRWGDVHLLKTLKFLHENGNLNHTVLMLLGDHGSRKQELRQTSQGQLEDRMPLAYVVLPPWFSTKYPMAVKNFKRNAETLTSAFDIHETLKDLTDLSVLTDTNVQYIRQRKVKVAEKKGHRRGTSLFTALPDHRGCISAGIPPHWCICYKKQPISIKSLDVHDAMTFILRSMNDILRMHTRICAKLKLHKIISALHWHPEEAIEDTYNGNAEENYKKSTLYQIKFVTDPGQGLFEVTVMDEPDNGWKFMEQVVRLDTYEEHSRCMEKQELKKLCQCIEPDVFPQRDALDTGHDFPIF